MLAALLLCTVVGISDGDTLVARCKAGTAPATIKVRLAEIDAPERAQPFGQRSRRHLADICFRREAQVEPISTDSYGRTVARVRCDRIDAGAEQVRAGMAWVFVRYAAKTSPLYRLERDARSARRGLWADKRPVPPWEWRAAAAPDLRR
jgi:endonuclease YncB( thermonuclease family)